MPLTKPMKRTENTCTQVQVCASEERLYIYTTEVVRKVCVCVWARAVREIEVDERTKLRVSSPIDVWTE